ASPVWRVILGLSRYGGLRTPSETLSLRWEDIDWEMNRMSIPEPKVEHHEGRGIRSCPIFPELRPILDETFEIFGGKSEFMVAAPQYQAAAHGIRHIPCAVLKIASVPINPWLTAQRSVPAALDLIENLWLSQHLP
ncbi:MAG: hypothetical protein ACKOOI_14580, partial [Pirellula sp.]